VTEVIVDPGTRNCRNMGDVAMLQVALARIREVLPDSTVRVFTDDPMELARQCPGVHALSHWAREAWLDDRRLWGALGRVLRGPAWRLASRVQGRVRQARPGLYRRALGLRFLGRPDAAKELTAFFERLAGADLLVFAGQGTLADAARDHARSMLATGAFAHAFGVPVFFFGQGIGPLTDPGLRRLAATVLPPARLVALREERQGRPLAEALGVASDRIVMTGDDAVELAATIRPDRPGGGLGIHLRVAPEALRTVPSSLRPVLHRFARARRVPLIPLPISHHRVGANDPRTIRWVLAGFDDASDGGATADTPREVIAAAGRCRAIVTGAYHAAVFGLAQGVPVVCLGRSAYYLDKFRGLRDQFGPGCQVLDLDDPALPDALVAALELAWEGADAFRAAIIRTADRQIAAGRDAYRRLASVASGGSVPAPLVAGPGASSR
jgi:polysaccharide pyruvyl transferase WcaK-like protein